MDDKIEQLAKELKLIKELQASDIYTANYQEARALFSLGYRKERDAAKEICDLILEYWKVDDFVDCNWVIEVISEKYGLDLGE